jgi:precorrin-6B methylase 2
MAFDDVMRVASGWFTPIEAAAAVAAQLKLADSGQSAPPEIAEKLRAVSEAAGLGDLDALAPHERGIALGLIQLYLHQASDLLADPGRETGWRFTDPVILDGWGRASTMVPSLISGAVLGGGDVASFLDVGTGVGLLAVAAANLWPNSTIVGVDRWESSLQRARANVAQAGLGERIEIRTQDVVDVDDVDRFDLVWVPTFFLTEATVTAALPGLLRSMRPGGRIVLGTSQAPPDALAAAVGALRTVRGGGEDLDPKQGVALLEQHGFESADLVTFPPPVPIVLVVGTKPAT